MDGEPEVGAALRFVFRDGDEPDAEGVEPSAIRARAGLHQGAETLRWELSPLPDGGCLLVFTTQVALPTAPANDNGAIRMRLAA